MTCLKWKPDSTVLDDTAEMEWMEKRRGRITCSQFGAIYGTGKAKDDEFTKAGYAYLRGIVAERLGVVLPSVSSWSIQWGNEHEAAAINAYRQRFLDQDQRCELRTVSVFRIER